MAERHDAMSVQVRLFGGVEAVIDGQVVDLGHARQRCVLAVLVAMANRPVSTDQLVDRVWGENPPPRSRAALYSYVSRLRTTLASTPKVTIERDPQGYRLIVDESDVDLHRSRTLITRARAGADDETALTLLAEALTLWRGEPFAGLDTPWLNGLRTALTAERYAAELDRTDLALRRGRHAELVAGLSVRVLEHPLDERLAGQYLLALRRTGRQADAITHYHLVRTMLADQLGTDPSAALQAIYHHILTGTDNRPAPPAPASVPRQLPAAPAWFTGREPEVTTLDRTAGTAGRTVVISAIAGTGGIGKTGLALHWAHQHVDRFPDGQLFVDLRGFAPLGEPLAPEHVIRGFLDGLGINPNRVPADWAAQTALYRSILADKRMLIVLDNAADADQVAPLLPGSPTCTVVITSRRHMPSLTTAHNAQHIPLGVLTEAEARHLLSGRLGADRVAAEADAVETLLACCAGFPLALGIVIGRALAHPTFPLSVLAAELSDDTSALGALDDVDAAASLPAVLSWSVRALTADQARMFGLLGIAPGPDISLSAAASLAALPSVPARLLLRELEHASLVQQHVPGRYRMHDLVRRYANETARERLTEDVRNDALRRVVDFYTHTAQAAHRVTNPHRAATELDPPAPGVHPEPLPDATAATAWLDAEHAALLAAQQTAADHTTAWHLATALHTFCGRRGHLDDRLTVWQVALRAVAVLPDPTRHIHAHRFLGGAYADLGRYDEGIEHLHHALALADEHDDTDEQARTHRMLAWAWGQRGDDKQALHHATRTLELVRTLDLPVREADALNMVGWSAAQLGEYDTAMAHCTAALALHRRHRNPDAEAATLDSLGYIAHHTGQHRQAVEYHQQALTLLRTLGDTYQAAVVLDGLGHPHVALGEYGQARAVWQEALELYQEHGRDTDAARVRGQLDNLESR